ncbi:MAG: hypothetical protein ACT4P8_07890 [Betaproteobacteria bacterium]
MSKNIVSTHRWLVFSLALTAAAGCNEGVAQRVTPEARPPVKESAPSLERYRPDARNVLRSRTDTARGRVWVLGLDGQVRVYDDRSKKPLRQIALPGWLVVRTQCMPDLIFDRTGFVLVSSNVMPWIWRIDADTFEMKVHQIRMPGREGLDFGFSTLALGAKGNLYGLAPSAQSLWSVDLGNANARPVQSYDPPLEQCTLTTRFVERVEAGG